MDGYEIKEKRQKFVDDIEILQVANPGPKLTKVDETEKLYVVVHPDRASKPAEVEEEEESVTENLKVAESNTEPVKVVEGLSIEGTTSEILEDFDVSKYEALEKEPFNAEKALERDRERVVKFFGLKAPNCLSTSYWTRIMLNNKKFILIDLSGTMHIEDTPTANAPNALKCLRSIGCKILFVTNSTKESRRQIHERLVRIGFEVGIEEIYTSLNATKSYILENELRPMFLIADEAMEDFEGVSTEDPNAVVIGLSSKDFNQRTLTTAMRLILEKDAKLIAIHKGRSYQTSTGTSLGPGCFVVALESATNKKAIVLGKPDEEFFKAALAYIGCDNPDQAVMIGDDVRDDVLGSMIVGLTGILVKTGKYRPSDECKILPQTPDYICNNFSEAVEMLIDAITDTLPMKRGILWVDAEQSTPGT